MSEGNVVDLPVITTIDTTPERSLQKAMKAGLTEVVIVGFDADGEFYFGSNKTDGGDVLWLLKLAEKRLLEIGDPK